MNERGETVKLDPPTGDELPKLGYSAEDIGYQAPAEDGSGVEVAVANDSERLQLLAAFPEWDGNNITGARVLIKAKGKCTTDHISMAGPWLKLRGHLDNNSNKMRSGAVNFFNEKTDAVKNKLTGDNGPVRPTKR